MASLFDSFSTATGLVKKTYKDFSQYLPYKELVSSFQTLQTPQSQAMIKTQPQVNPLIAKISQGAGLKIPYKPVYAPQSLISNLSILQKPKFESQFIQPKSVDLSPFPSAFNYIRSEFKKTQSEAATAVIGGTKRILKGEFAKGAFKVAGGLLEATPIGQLTSTAGRVAREEVVSKIPVSEKDYYGQVGKKVLELLTYAPEYIYTAGALGKGATKAVSLISKFKTPTRIFTNAAKVASKQYPKIANTLNLFSKGGLPFAREAVKQGTIMNLLSKGEDIAGGYAQGAAYGGLGLLSSKLPAGRLLEPAFQYFGTYMIEKARGLDDKEAQQNALANALIATGIGIKDIKIVLSEAKVGGTAFWNELANTKDVVVSANFAGAFKKLGKAIVEGSKAQSKLRERGFIKTIKKAPETAKEVTTSLEKGATKYTPIILKNIQQQAKDMVKESSENAFAFVSEGKEITPEKLATGIELIKKFQNSAKYEEAANVADLVAQKFTLAGQSINAAKLYSTLDPSSILIRAQKVIRKSNENKWRWQKDLELSDETAKQLSQLADQMKKTEDLDLKLELSSEIESILRSIPRSNVGRKLSTLQTIAQLLNPKTIMVRNPLGNELFYRLERINKYITTPIDLIRSKLTGTTREVTFKSVKQGDFWKSFLKGLKAGWKGVSPEGITTQFEITAPAFKSKWNPLTYLEKTLGATLKGFDYAAYKRAKNVTIGELSYLKALNEGLKGENLKSKAIEYSKNIDDNLLQIADEYGKYVTYQDNNLLSQGFSAIKRGLNVGKEFGLGDFILKYPKTPGAIMMRALEYSPVGFLRSAYLLAKPILKARGKVNTREIEIALARAITGTLGLTGMGYYLADKGIITGQKEQDQDVQALQKQIGAGAYKVNLSALKRWVLSGFDDNETKFKEGDTLYSYDWAQPAALAVSLGANINKNIKEAAEKQEQKGLYGKVTGGSLGTIGASLAGGIESITEQPVLSGLKRFFQGGFTGESAMAAVQSVIEDIPTSFTPTLLNQIRQFKDNVARETYDPELLKRMVNKIKSRLPELSKTLPAQYTTLGEKKSIFQNPSLFNVFFNPGFISKYNPTKAAQVVLNLFSATGEKGFFPKVVPKKVTLYDKEFNLTGEQISNFQKQIGESTNYIFTLLADNPKFQKASDENKQNMLNYFLGNIYNAGKLNTLTKEQKQYLIKEISDEQKKNLADSIVKYSPYLILSKLSSLISLK